LIVHLARSQGRSEAVEVLEVDGVEQIRVGIDDALVGDVDLRSSLWRSRTSSLHGRPAKARQDAPSRRTTCRRMRIPG
jgi:hypothetical protein